MSKWKEYKLGEVAEIIMGQSPKSETYNKNKVGLPFLQGNRTFGRINPYFDTYCDSPKKIASEKDILFSVRAPVGDINIAQTEICIGRGLASFRAINKEYRFLYYLLLFIKQNIISVESGTVYGSVNRTDLENTIVNIPPLPEQKAIAEVLSSLDDKIDLLHRQNETLEKMAETLFRKWFVEDADDGWEEKKLGEIGEIKAGGDKPKVYSDIKTANCNIPIYSNGISNEGLYGYTDTARIISESITISARGTIGFISLRQEPYFPIVRLISITPDENIVSSKYLYLWAKSQNISGTGTTQQQLTAPDISARKMTIPPLKLMNEFTHIVESFFSKKQFNKSQIRTLEKLRDTLLPKLISGEVRVAIN